jgi:HlyD family secretion protein
MKKTIIILLIVLTGVSGGWYLWSSKGNGKDREYDFVEITRGDLENVNSSTGTLNPVSTVQVGTQVSGIIDKVLVDFNYNVKKGQILAVLDTKNLNITVRDAEAGLLKAKAQYEQGQADHQRAQKMFDKSLISDQDLLTSKTQEETSLAGLKSAEASLERANTNLDYAVIRSPINGIVIYRNVEEGQTVAASFSTPTLFNIAEDLSRMEIHALVDESDIGQIKEKMPVRFTVEAYYDKKFSGTVRQIWLQPTTVQNVVNYTVVIDGDNKEGLLLPGMTATVDFLIDQKKDVLLVPNTALRFKPTPEMISEFQRNIQKNTASQPDSLRKNRPNRPDTFKNGQDWGSQLDAALPKGMGRLWLLDEQGRLSMRMVRTGITDGRMTEIVKGRDIQEGMKVISGIREKTGQTNTALPAGPGGFRRSLF